MVEGVRGEGDGGVGGVRSGGPGDETVQASRKRGRLHLVGVCKRAKINKYWRDMEIEK